MSIEDTRRRLATLEARAAARARTRDAARRFALTRDELDAAIRAAHAAGVPDTETAADSGFTRQWIGKLLRRR